MRGDVVLVRSFRGAPIRRTVWGRVDGAILLLRPDHYERAQRGEEVHPIGFPVEDVFEFDMGLYERLKVVMIADPTSLPELWREAHPYSR